MQLPSPLESALRPLLDLLPPEQAMSRLVVTAPRSEELTRTVEGLLQDPALAGNRRLAAGLWLYVDELDRSHKLSQSMEDSTGSYWHAIMHRREGGFSNSHYWFNRVRRHPAMDDLPGYDPHRFVDEVETAQPGNPDDLVRRQREEWAALFTWCARETG